MLGASSAIKTRVLSFYWVAVQRLVSPCLITFGVIAVVLSSTQCVWLLFVVQEVEKSGCIVFSISGMHACCWGVACIMYQRRFAVRKAMRHSLGCALDLD